MKNRFLTSLLAACGLLLTLARPALGQAPTFIEAVGLNPGGAIGNSTIFATATNAAGDQYVSGRFTNTLVLGSTTLVSTPASLSNDDIFVAKRSGSTGAWLWAVGAGSPDLDESLGIAVDAGGNALVTGRFGGTVSFATRTAPVVLTSAGGLDVFVAKFSGADGAAVWAVRAGGPGNDEGKGVAVDGGGNALVTGYFLGTATFATRTAATTLTSAGSTDVFVAKFASTDGAAAWAVRAGGPDLDQGRSVAVDRGGNALVTGLFDGTASFATRPTATTLASAGSIDAFVAKFAGTDGATAWAVGAGGVSLDYGYGIAVDAGGNALVMGLFLDTATFATRPAATALTSAGSTDLFVAKLSGADGAVAWAVRAGGPATDYGSSVAVDAGGNALVTGFFDGTASFATRPTATTLASAGSTDVFVAKFAGTDGATAWAVRAGGSDFDQGTCVTVDAGGNALVAGSFNGAASFGSLALVGGGGRTSTGFVAKLQAAAPSATTTSLNKAALTLTPNPTRTATTLTLPAAAQARAVTVADALGRMVLKTTLPAQATALALDVSKLAPGVYTVRCAAATARLVVE